MKVMALSGISLHAGGVYLAVSSLCRHLHAGGVTMTVAGRDERLAEEHRVNWGDIPVNYYTPYGPMASSVALRKFMGASGADLCHLHGIWLDDQWASLQWQRNTGRPVVISPHGMLDPWALQHSAWKKALVARLFARASLEQATCFHALCRSEAESIRAYGLKNPIAVIPNGVDLPELSPSGTAVSGEKKNLLYLGRIHPKKGLDELIDAWAVAGIEEAWNLQVAGWDDGGHLPALKKKVSELGLDGSVEFTGPTFGEEKRAILRGASAFILPSFSEGLPVSVLEAWSYARPVLMTEFCNLPEGFQVGAALRIQPESASIAQGLKELAAMSDAERIELGAAGRQLVEKQFTWGRIAESMKAVYAWCRDGGTPPNCVERV